jgi:hypothetical protein
MENKVSLHPPLILKITHEAALRTLARGLPNFEVTSYELYPTILKIT